ncbi:MAG: DNA translocase FtsK [Patescibacteria group bacterium]
MPRRKKGLKFKLRSETVHSIIAVFFLALGGLVLISFTGQGRILQILNQALIENLGFSTLVLPFVFFAAGLVMLKTKWAWSKPTVLLGAILVLIGVMGLFKTGSIGENTFANLAELLSPVGSGIFFVAVLISGALILTEFSLTEIFDWIARLREKRSSNTDEQSEGRSGFSLPKISMPFKPQNIGFSINQNSDKTLDDAEDDDPGTAVVAEKTKAEAAGQTEDGELSTTLMNPNTANMIWEYPPLSLLNESEGGQADRGDIKKNAQVIEETLNSFGVHAGVEEVNYGPSVTQYALRIKKQGTKLSKITSLSTDLALALAAPTGQIRIEAPIAGRSLVGVEVPNYSAQYVTLRKLLASPDMKKHPSKLATALGINVAGKPMIMDIAKMPHVLIAGATGSGKSVAINTFMCSILFRASPAEVKLILVDPKRVELTGYNDIPHLLVPVIVDPKKVVSALKWATHQMEERYKQLAEVGVKNIAAYNELAGHAAMPSIVIVIDELADIMLYAPSEVEESITRIAQMARAVGIHLVLATQRPSVDVITGLIKANIPARIAFNVSSMMDSRVILDSQGAEKLLGKGDMLFIPPDQAKPVRIQGTYVEDSEIKSLIDFIKSQGQKPNYEDDITDKYKVAADGSKVANPDEKDELFGQAAQFVAAEGKGSSSLIQRRFSVGYNRAARILDQLHAAGMVGPSEGSKPREVYSSKIMEYLRSVENQQ